MKCHGVGPAKVGYKVDVDQLDAAPELDAASPEHAGIQRSAVPSRCPQQQGMRGLLGVGCNPKGEGWPTSEIRWGHLAKSGCRGLPLERRLVGTSGFAASPGTGRREILKPRPRRIGAPNGFARFTSPRRSRSNETTRFASLTVSSPSSYANDVALNSHSIHAVFSAPWSASWSKGYPIAMLRGNA